MSRRRVNGEGSIYAYPRGYRAYVWVTTPSGRRQRKYVTGKTREIVREKYLKLALLIDPWVMSGRVVRVGGRRG